MCTAIPILAHILTWKSNIIMVKVARKEAQFVVELNWGTWLAEN